MSPTIEAVAAAKRLKRASIQVAFLNVDEPASVAKKLFNKAWLNAVLWVR